MTSRVLHLRLKDWVLIGCLEFVTDKQSITDAVRRALEAFILVLQRQGKIPKHSQEEIEQLLIQYRLVSGEEYNPEGLVDINLDELLSNALAETEEKPPAEAIGREVEERIRKAATPSVRTKVELIEGLTANEVNERVGVAINLFAQQRVPLMTLFQAAPKDMYIEQALAVINTAKNLDKVELSDIQKVEIAALEIVYSNLSRDLWGTPFAKNQIEQLIKAHGR